MILKSENNKWTGKNSSDGKRLATYPSLYTKAVINKMTKSKFQKEKVIWRACPDHGPSEEEEKVRNRSRNLKSNTEEENMEECTVLALLFMAWLNSFSYP